MILDGDTPVTEYATSVSYPAGHASEWAGETMLMRALDNEALARRRADVHRDQGAATRVLRRTWTPGEWEAA